MESFIDYQVPPDRFSPLAEFDGVIAERTAGEVSARCHDDEANSLALNLMHDIVTGQKTVEEARSYYAKEFADYRRKQPTPYMDKLHFTPGSDTNDPDARVLSDEDLEEATEEGRKKEGSAGIWRGVKERPDATGRPQISTTASGGNSHSPVEPGYTSTAQTEHGSCVRAPNHWPLGDFPSDALDSA